MKNLNNYIFEKLKINKDTKVKEYNYHPKDKEELSNIIINRIRKAHEKDKDIMDFDLNDIDTSEITDMSKLFRDMRKEVSFNNVDVSKWNVSKVESFNNCFTSISNFNCNLSEWDVSSCEDFESMFEGCYKFESDLKDWDFGNAKKVRFMFCYCYKFDTDVSDWDLSGVDSITRLFDCCKSFRGIGIDKMKLNKDIIKDKENRVQTFNNCYNIKKLPSWYEES